MSEQKDGFKSRSGFIGGHGHFNNVESPGKKQLRDGNIDYSKPEHKSAELYLKTIILANEIKINSTASNEEGSKLASLKREISTELVTMGATVFHLNNVT